MLPEHVAIQIKLGSGDLPRIDHKHTTPPVEGRFGLWKVMSLLPQAARSSFALIASQPPGIDDTPWPDPRLRLRPCEQLEWLVQDSNRQRRDIKALFGVMDQMHQLHASSDTISGETLVQAIARLACGVIQHSKGDPKLLAVVIAEVQNQAREGVCTPAQVLQALGQIPCATPQTGQLSLQRREDLARMLMSAASVPAPLAPAPDIQQFHRMLLRTLATLAVSDAVRGWMPPRPALNHSSQHRPRSHSLP